MTERRRHQVVVVGGGPCGQALAIELGRQGIDCGLVDRHVHPQPIPKGQNLTQRTMEHFRRWGCEAELRSRRVLPPGYPIGGIVCYGDLTSEYWHAPVGREAVGAYYAAKNERLPQYETEAVLRRHSASLDTVHPRYGWTMTSLSQDDDGVTVNVEDGDGAEAVLRADYAVGCDGARSAVREWSGIRRTGPPLARRMLLVVLRSRDLHRALERFPERTTYRAMHPELAGYWRFFGRVDLGERWFFHAPVPDGHNPAVCDVPAALQQAAGFRFEADLDHVGFWDLRIELAESYRCARVLIAGDACHSHPPYGGYGLNTGMEDAVNLAWKLAASLQGWGGSELLDSYDTERRPVFVETGVDVIAAGIERDRSFLSRYSPVRDREAFEEAWAREMDVADTGPQWYEPHYEGSPIVDGPPDGRSGVHGQHSFVARPGHHLAPRRRAEGTLTFDALGSGFTLLSIDPKNRSIAALQDAFAGRRVPLHVVREEPGGESDVYGSRLVLVRPDQFVAWAGDDLPGDPGELAQLVTGGGTGIESRKVAAR